MVEQLASLHLPYTAKDQNGKDVPYVVQAHLQPIQLWSYVFPKEHLDTILRTLKPQSSIGIPLGKDHPAHDQKTGSPARKWSLGAIRKFLKLQPVPYYDPEGLKFPIWNENTQVIGIGIKEDYENKFGNEAL